MKGGKLPTPEHFFSHWERVSRRLRSGTALFLFDFDGTLTPIVEVPDDARLDPESKFLLRRLSRCANFRVGVVSGRALQEVRRKVALHGVILSGNHGLEISGLGEEFIHPQARARAGPLKRLAVSLRKDLSGFQGVVVEWKKLSLSVHYRVLLPSRVSLFKRFFRKWVRRKAPGFTILPGKMVFDILPVANWTKGSAVRWILRRFRPRTTLYVGDDRTDQDAFRALGPGDISVSIGPRVAPGAQYRLNNTGETRMLLQKLMCL